MTKTVYYEDGRFIVTPSSFETPEGAFPIREIGSARRGKRSPTRIPEIALLVLCVIFASVARAGSPMFWFAAAATGAASISLSLVRRDVYLILLYLGSGERSISIGGRELSIRVCNAINVAVVEGHSSKAALTQPAFDVTLPDLASELSIRPTIPPAYQQSV